MSNSKDDKTTSVAVVNKQQILIIPKDGVDYVPTRPICDALGVDPDSQLKRIKRDPIFSSVAATVTATGADGKQYEMAALPHEFIFGWLFTIDANQVKPEVRDAVIQYKRECNHALYHHFKSYADYVTHRSALIEQAVAAKETIRHEFNTAKDRLKASDESLREAISFTYYDYLQGKRQLQLDFNAENIEP